MLIPTPHPFPHPLTSGVFTLPNTFSLHPRWLLRLQAGTPTLQPVDLLLSHSDTSWERGSLGQEKPFEVSGLLYYYIFIVGGVAHMLWAHSWRSKDNFPESVLSFHHVGSRDGTQVVRFSGSRLNHLTYLQGPYSFPHGDRLPGR